MARATMWVDTVASFTVNNGAEQMFTLMGLLSSEDSRGLTLTRLIGQADMCSTTVAGAWGVQAILYQLKHRLSRA